MKVDDLIVKVEELKLKSKQCEDKIEIGLDVHEAIRQYGKVNWRLLELLEENSHDSYIFDNLLEEESKLIISKLRRRDTDLKRQYERCEERILAQGDEKDTVDEEIKNIKKKVYKGSVSIEQLNDSIA